MPTVSIGPQLGAAVLALACTFAVPPAWAEAFSGNDLRDIRIGVAAADLPDSGYVGFACAQAPEKTLTGWQGWSECPPGEDGTHAIRFGFDPRRSRDGTIVAGHPALLTLSVDKAGQVVGLDIVTDPAARLYLRKKAFLLGKQAMSRYGEEGWTCSQSKPGADEEPVGGVYVKERCTKITAGRSLVIDRSLFRRAGQDIRSFVDETRIVIRQAKS